MSRYKVIRNFAVRGPSRRVQLAEDAVLKRLVILKSDADAAAMEHEASLMTRCSSCHVVACYDLLRSPESTTCVIEYFCGSTLKDVLDRAGGRLAPDKALNVARSILLALQDMNRAGVVYRDLHPGHISYLDRDRLKIFDLGLALLVPEGGSVPNPHLHGTWETMAPEEFVANSGVGAPANVYSAAALIYRMIAGYYPLDYQRMVKGWQELDVEAQKRRQQDLHGGTAPDFSVLPDKLRVAFQKALAKRPADRYANVGEFRSALFDAR